MSESKFLQRYDSVFHVAAGVAAYFISPLLVIPYGAYLYANESHNDKCNKFVQGVEYGVGYFGVSLVLTFLQNKSA